MTCLAGHGSQVQSKSIPESGTSISYPITTHQQSHIAALAGRMHLQCISCCQPDDFPGLVFVFWIPLLIQNANPCSKLAGTADTMVWSMLLRKVRPERLTMHRKQQNLWQGPHRQAGAQMLMAPSLQAPLANAPSQSTLHLAGDAAGKLGQSMMGCPFLCCALLAHIGRALYCA